MKRAFFFLFLFPLLMFADVQILQLGNLGEVRYHCVGGQLVRVDRVDKSGELLYSHAYEYDEQGRLVHERLIGNTGEVYYSRDERSWSQYHEERVERDERGFVAAYELDGVREEFSYDDERKLELDEKAYELDSNGDVTSFGGATLIYSNHLLTSYKKDGHEISYEYDSHGRRVSKTIDGKTEKYIFAGLNEIGVIDDNNSLEVLRIPGLVHKDYIRTISIETKDAIYAPIHDFRGNIIKLVNIKTKEVTELVKPDPYGSNIKANPFQCWNFSGKFYDNDSGLVYFGHRYYAPEIGRWLTPDPEEQSADLYEYCLSNPLSYFDPDGRNAIAIPLIAWEGALTFPLWGPGALAFLGGASLYYFGSKGYEYYKKKHSSPDPDATPPYTWEDLGPDPSKCPDDGFEWKGRGDPSTEEGAWHKPSTDESLHPDFNHPGDVRPHWDYQGPNGEKARIFEDGTWEWK